MARLGHITINLLPKWFCADSVEELTTPRNVQPMDRNVQNVTTSYVHHFARVCRSRRYPTNNQATDPPVPKTQMVHSKKVFTLEDSEIHPSDNESNFKLLIDPLRINGLTKPSAWLSLHITRQHHSEA